MEYSRQEAFKKLRDPCVELSSVGLRYRGHQASPNDVFRALKPVQSVLKELSSKGSLDEKLAEYAFFPLSHIFNESQRISANCLELAVDCLRILVADGWRQRLSPQMGKQLMILLTLIIGGPPSKANSNQQTKSKPAELSIAGFDCLSAIFDVMEGPVAQRTIYNEIGTATVVDQTVYVLLEGILDTTSDDLCVSAAKALQALYYRITDRVVLASVMPRTVSTLTKVIKPTTQVRRSYKLLSACIKVLTHMLKVVLNDQVASVAPEKPAQSQECGDGLVLDESWLKATTTQIKLALANVIQVRRHDRPEVQESLLELCSMVVEDCRSTLQESLPLVVETMVVLSETSDDESPNNAYTILMHLATAYAEVLDALKNSLHAWITAFPRTMQSNDETSKQWALKQISTAFQILSQIQSGSDILTTGLASGLCDSVSAAINHSNNALQPLNPETSGSQTLEVLHHGNQSRSFPPVLLEHRSQQQTLKDLQSMILRLNRSESGSNITRLIINRVHQKTGNSIAPFWLALEFLKSGSQLTSLDEFISSDFIEPSSLVSTRANMIEELYYISLPVLSESLPDESKDWRTSALALEVIALQAQQLHEEFRPELMDALYPVLQLLSSPNPNLQRHAMVCLNVLTEACNYESTSTMVIENVDYLVNSVALKLNTFDVSPYPPQVLFMMVKLCGVRLIPYLDDLVDSIFGILDMYHGYPKLVEMMFKTLAAIVEEGTKSPSFLAIGDGTDSNRAGHRKKQHKRLQISTLAKDLKNRKAKRARHLDDFPDADKHVSHPERPWTTKPDKPVEPEEDIETLLNKATEESDEPLPAPREPEAQEKPLSKSHNLLLHIIKSIPSHLSSPSPYLRRSLLSILTQVSPILSGHENSFLPIINEVWPSVAARISLPSSFTSSSSSTALMAREDSNNGPKNRPDDEFDFKEEIYVTTTACQAIESMCKSAGDFMATRIETEFPRWERLYRRVWETVRQDAEKAIQRRARSQATNEKTDILLSLSLGLSQSLSLNTAGGPSGTRTFTPHHSLWRALLSLFITLLTHVRLPLSMGDQICEFLAAWIARFAGPDYYSSSSSSSPKQEIPSSLRPEIDTVNNAIEAMEIWNVDLTWFIFQQQKVQVRDITPQRKTPSASLISEIDDDPLQTWSSPGNKLKFAASVF
ncbi:HEAT repeat protein [Aspergillus nomiae NRRL 13137]|uniref:HEAT repeat protein n=1 Tax=Aspergillus nomiae NRRL (strain ATCC 15546 / NRRL 13137 / CBS 260.88 / M93) TaxID=1509407 RepID=A0A0L1JCP2_ASPN3|nr:HEAT repeat protein [Aspergillus nomiae NRRL 13137]KNG89505.1 HEAT repeat protein [Aspergillus nomiae NRRL 13137]